MGFTSVIDFLTLVFLNKSLYFVSYVRHFWLTWVSLIVRIACFKKLLLNLFSLTWEKINLHLKDIYWWSSLRCTAVLFPRYSFRKETRKHQVTSFTFFFIQEITDKTFFDFTRIVPFCWFWTFLFCFNYGFSSRKLGGSRCWLYITVWCRLKFLLPIVGADGLQILLLILNEFKRIEN